MVEFTTFCKLKGGALAPPLWTYLATPAVTLGDGHPHDRLRLPLRSAAQTRHRNRASTMEPTARTRGHTMDRSYVSTMDRSYVSTMDRSYVSTMDMNCASTMDTNCASTTDTNYASTMGTNYASTMDRSCVSTFHGHDRHT